MNKFLFGSVNSIFNYSEQAGLLCGKIITGFTDRQEHNKQTKEYLQYLVAPLAAETKSYNFETVKELERCLKINDKYFRVYYLATLPNNAYAASLFKLINLPLPMTLSYHIEGTNKASMLRAARQRLSVLESSQNGLVKKGRSRDPETDREIGEVSVFINDLVHDFEKTFQVGIYAGINAGDRKQLLEYDRKFQDETEDSEFVFNTYSYAQARAYQSLMPLGEDPVREKHLLQTSAVVNLLPFLTRNLNDPTGIFFGVNHYNNSLILIDIFKARNANMNIFGTSGSGKSVTAKLIMTRLVLRGIQNIIIDPEGEYCALTRSLGGSVVSFNSQAGIDPFELLNDPQSDPKEYIQILKNFFSFFIQEQNKDYSLLDKILMKTYFSPGLVNIKKFLRVLDTALGRQNPGLYQDLFQLLQGSLGGLFQNTLKIDLNQDMICFDLSGLYTDEKKIPLTYLIGCVINKLINNVDRKRMIFIDEAHKLLANQATTAFYVDLVKTARKRKTGVVSITQNPEDFKENDNSKTIITQAETTILLKQAPASLNYIQRFDLFRLTERECSDLACFTVGEALFIREREHILLDIFPFPSEKELVFT